MLHELSLFSGYGGFSLGLKLAGLDIRTVAYVEIDPYCQKLIQQRIKDGYLDDGPIYPDIRAFDGRECRGLVDLVTAGFPCQPHSTAGKRLGAADERNLWPDTLRVIRNVGPRYVLLENVPGLLANGYAGTVVGELAEVGYDCVWDLVPAATVGAPHLRWRWWALGYPRSNQWDGWRCGQGDILPTIGTPTRQEQAGHDGEHWSGAGSQIVADSKGESGTLRSTERERLGRPAGVGDELANADSTGREGTDLLLEGGFGSCGSSQTFPVTESKGLSFGDGQRTQGFARPQLSRWWEVEPSLGRVVDGRPHRVDELKALGNGIVPAVVAEFLWRLNGAR